jgi:hypothetical protein
VAFKTESQIQKIMKYLLTLTFVFSFVSVIGQNPNRPKKVEKDELGTENRSVTLIEKTDEYHEPDSIFIKGRNYDVFDSTLIPSHKALGGNIFIGHGIYNGNISEYFSNPYFIGINVDIHRKNFVIQIDDYIGFGKTNQTLTFPDQKEWGKNKAALSFMFGGNLGYSIIDNKHLKLVPLAGINATLLSSTFLTTSDNSENEPFLPYYKIGFYIDFKSLVLLQEHIRINNVDENYTSLRLSFGLNSPIGNPKHSEYYKGPMFYLTIGMGGLSRQFMRK